MRAGGRLEVARRARASPRFSPTPGVDDARPRRASGSSRACPRSRSPWRGCWRGRPGRSRAPAGPRGDRRAAPASGQSSRPGYDWPVKRAQVDGRRSRSCRTRRRPRGGSSRPRRNRGRACRVCASGRVVIRSPTAASVKPSATRVSSSRAGGRLGSTRFAGVSCWPAATGARSANARAKEPCRSTVG